MMATTSLWHIEGRLKDLIAYVENPEKTVANNSALQPLWEIMSYVSRPEATEQGEYVSTINCLKEIALQQMILTKKQYGKENGYIAWHGYQSFKPDEVTAKEAHEIGLQTAREMWGDRYQIIVTTHLDKDHLHNHFCFNSVSFIDGGKYDYSKTEQRKLRSVSDRICAEHGLSVIKNPHKAPTRQVSLNERINNLGTMQQNKDRFINAIRRFMEMQKLTAPLLRELIDEITVYETEGVGKNRSQRIMIHYKFIGYIEIPECGSNYKADTRKGVAVEYITKSA